MEREEIAEEEETILEIVTPEEGLLPKVENSEEEKVVTIEDFEGGLVEGSYTKEVVDFDKEKEPETH